MKKAIITFFLIAMILLMAACNRPGPTVTQAGRTDLNLVTITENFATLDPHFMDRAADRIVAAQIFERLFLIEDDQSLTPQLAERYTVSADGLTYTFHLRRGVTFCNGDVFTADDVIYSLARAQRSPQMFVWVQQIESFRKIDDYTVEIRSNTLSALFATYMSSIYIINSKHAERVGDITEDACGTGAYMLESQRRNVNLVLTANENYWGGAPPIKTLRWEIMGNEASALISFEAGELDMIGVPSANWDTIVAQNKWTTDLLPRNHITYIVMNHEVAPFNDVRVRQAINHAINRDDMVILAMDGLAMPALTMANPDLVFGATNNVTTHDFNLQRARQLLAEAGYPNGLEIPPILTMGGMFFEAVAVVAQDALRNIGITTRVEIREAASYVPTLFAGDFAIAVLGMNTSQDYDFFRRLYHSAFINNVNISRYSNPRVDELFDTGLQTIDPQARQAVYADLIGIVQRDAVYAPVFFMMDAIAHDPNLNIRLRATGSLYKEFSWGN
ncbi:MAG: ABC transporter substrate-binding protein [Treponema sp.]|nr:ABC transporter substrate-binding protein [Treponema sp.]